MNLDNCHEGYVMELTQVRVESLKCPKGVEL